eukprot:CAMPEP_0195540988 /NCGR_PEP_ID=MMETSP0794_2-20130614/50854_1 /TAXON_ID=515487 /ORGANISM="Stephanopyxis turris, Strain CCMP 815" /LENGTH=593 /DNA_ID=CAMNT_0040675071 /DNA_START=14 /DNA_END=1792 /DNA_ORIENTATION=+
MSFQPQRNDHEGGGQNSSNISSSSVTDAARNRQALTWSRVVPAAGSKLPPPRSGAASVVVKGRLYMFGGYGGGTGRLDDFYSFSFDTCTWEEVRVLSSAKPGCRENNGVVIGDSSRVYLFGGYNGTAWLNDLWMFDIDTQRWECIQESSDPSSEPTQPAAAAAAAANLAETLRGGGRGGNNANNNHTAPSRRFGYVSVVHKGKFVLFGGFDGSKWLNDMYEFDFKTKTWTEIMAHGTLPSVRSCPAWAKDDKNVYIQGGYDGVERKADFFACDLSTYTWTEMPCRGTPPSPRYFHSCCLYGNKMYAYGGYSGSERLADMYAYDFETNHWSEVDCSQGDCPSGRSSLVAQVYENSLYIFGGYNGVTVLNDFYKFRLKPVSIPPPLLCEDLHRLINQEEYADVTFLVEGQEVHANRAILAVRSEFFRALLFNHMGMRESLTWKKNDEDPNSDGRRGTIELKDVSHEVFLKVMEYLYTDSVRDITLDISIPLLIMSERFMLDRLKGLCEDSIRQDISVDNVIGVFIASHRHHASGLKDIALDFILKNIKDPAIMHGLADLKSEPDLLVEIIKRNSGQSSHGPPPASSGPFGSSSEW